jgi:choline dehydrogenase-like flavoprotein
VSELPRAVEAGARVRAGVEVEGLDVKGGRARGVIADGYSVEARAVVLAGGAIGTPELLLRQGLGNRQVGRHLHIHPACWVGARYPDPVRGWEGVMQSWEVSEWRDRGLFLEATFTPLAFGAHWLRGAGAAFKERIEGYDHLGIIGVHYSERTAEGRVRVGRSGSARVTYRLPPEEAAQIRYGIARAADLHFAAGALEVHPQVGAVGSLRPGEQAGIEDGRFRPADLRLEAFHPMGSARMGADAASSAVDPDGALRGLDGAYVVDGSLLPTSLRVNPMLTIMACSRRIAASMADRLS